MKQGIFLRQMATDATEAVVEIVGVIGWDVGFAQIRQIIAAIPENVQRVTFDIYSPGGDVWDGNAMIHEIGAMKQDTVAFVRVAASMATLLAVACKKRVMAANGRFLVHNPWTAAQGDAAEFEKRAKELRDAQNEAAKFYAARTGKTADEMLALMDEERWQTAQEAKDFGFVQEIADPFDVAAFAPLQAALAAAGQWPKALIEIPAEAPPAPVEETKDEVAKPDGAEVAPVVARVPAPAADDNGESERIAAAIAGEYARGLAAGAVQGEAHAVEAFAARVSELTERLAHAESESRKHQGRADALGAQLAAAQKQGDERAAALRADIEVLTGRLKAHLAGALSWESSVETWEDAMRASGGDYAKAAAQYPELLKQYRAAASRQKVSR